MSAAETAVETPAIEEPPGLLRLAIVRGLVVLGIIAVGIFFLIASDEWLNIANYTMLAAIAALSLNVLSGYTGQVSLGIAFFMAIGAYTAVWLGGDPTTTFFINAQKVPALGLGLSWLIWLPGAGIVAAIAGAIIGPTALRLKGFYLGIVSLALIFIGQQIFVNASRLTGGPGGRSFPSVTFGSFDFSQQNTILGVAVTSNQQYFLLILVILVIAAVFVHNVMRSRAGRAFQAVRDNETGAAILGVNLFEAKMGAFILSAFLAGIAGALFAAFNSYVRPDYWGLLLSIQYVAAIIVGGIASVWGSILGAAFVFALPQIIELLTPQSQSSTSTGVIFGIASGDLNAAIYGLLIIVFLLFEPAGMIGLIRRGQLLVRRLSNRPRKGGEPAKASPNSVHDSEFEVESSTLSTGDGA
ncbi:MAG TPA: branched-chain amino acid ABC transporter permease [Ktedonobacterales bacterium]|nr:branched-chain amino acid ABC transporter permease [Ktedonobacterales bacterium]